MLGAACSINAVITSVESEADTMIKAADGILTGSFVLTDDYVELPDGGGADGAIEFAVSCPAVTSIRLFTQVIAPDGGSNSFYIKVGAQSRVTWHIQKTSSFDIRTSPEVMLDAGINRLQLLGREDGIKIRTVTISGCIFLKAA